MGHAIAMLFTLHIPEALVGIGVGRHILEPSMKKKRYILTSFIYAFWLMFVRVLYFNTSYQVPLVFIGMIICLFQFGKCSIKSSFGICGIIAFEETLGEAMGYPIAKLIGIPMDQILTSVFYHTMMGWIMLVPLIVTWGILHIVKNADKLKRYAANFRVSSQSLNALFTATITIQVLSIVIGRMSRITQAKSLAAIHLITPSEFLYLMATLLAAVTCFATIAMINKENKEKIELEKRLNMEVTASLQQLEKAQKQLLQAERYQALGEIAGGMAHAFNNILAGIRGRAQIMQMQIKDYSTGNSANLDQHLSRILINVDEASEALKRIRDISGDHNDSERVVFDVEKTVRNGIEDSKYSRSSISIHTELEQGCWIRGIPSQIKDAVVNLVNNAGDALNECGDIRISLSKQADKVLLSIEDNAGGISEEVLSKVFLPFYSTKKGNGMGLGLSIVKGIITRHGGEITVDSQLGKGTRFAIELPLCEKPEIVGGIDIESAILPYGLKIAVVDDNEDTAQVLSSYLQGLGCKVSVATSLADRQKIIADTPSVDITITDLSMPGISGLDISQAFNKKGIPIILITGWDWQIDRSSLGSYGIRKVIAKPFDLASLAQEIALVVNKQYVETA